jgi:uncharacterized membrane protein (DUF106 family)
MSEDRTTWLRHPLVNMVIGFILTGVLGTAITQHFLDQREQERLRAQVALDTKQAIQQFAKLNEERKGIEMVSEHSFRLYKENLCSDSNCLTPIVCALTPIVFNCFSQSL